MAINFTENGRQKLLAVCVLQCVINFILGIGLFMTGGYIKLQVAVFARLLSESETGLLYYFIIGTGFLTFFSGIFGWKIVSDSRIPELRQSRSKLFVVYFVICFVANLFLITIGIMCFIHIKHLHSAFKDGILESMKRYKTDVTLKAEIDRMQMKYSCCGSHGYVDWFDISWINEKYLRVDAPNLKGKMKTGEYLNDDVPFSCCSPESDRPCIQHHVHDNDRHYKYDFRSKTTLNKIGCKDALMLYFGDILLKSCGIGAFVILVLQILSLFTTRLLQTSIYEALESGDPCAPGQGYICQKKKPTSDDQEDLGFEELESDYAEEGQLLNQQQYHPDANQYQPDPYQTKHPTYNSHTYAGSNQQMYNRNTNAKMSPNSLSRSPQDNLRGSNRSLKDDTMHGIQSPPYGYPRSIRSPEDDFF